MLAIMPYDEAIHHSP